MIENFGKSLINGSRNNDDFKNQNTTNALETLIISKKLEKKIIIQNPF